MLLKIYDIFYKSPESKDTTSPSVVRLHTFKCLKQQTLLCGLQKFKMQK